MSNTNQWWNTITTISAAVAAIAAAIALYLNLNMSNLQVESTAPIFSIKNVKFIKANQEMFPDQEMNDKSMQLVIELSNVGQRPADSLLIIVIYSSYPPIESVRDLRYTLVPNPIFPGDTPTDNIFIGDFEKDESPKSVVIEIRYKDILIKKPHRQRFYMKWAGGKGYYAISQLSHMSDKDKVLFDCVLSTHFDEFK